MSYEAVGEIVRGHGGRVFHPHRQLHRRGVGSLGIDINGQGAGLDPSMVWSFYMLPGIIGLLGLWVVAKVFGSRSA